MSERNVNAVKKKYRKVKRVPIPKTIGDYIDNMSIDLKNYARYVERVERDIDKIKWHGFQFNDNLQQVIKILRQRGLYKSIRDKEQL